VTRQRWLTWLALCGGGLALAGSAHLLFAQPAPADPASAAAPPPVLAPAPAATPSEWGPRIRLLAGDGHVGRQDGPAAQARFADPYGLALDTHGRLYVADAGDNNLIRVVQPDGSVGTLAGGSEGFADGTGSAARFNTPSGLALDAAGNLYVADTGNHAIRKVSPDGQVSTLAGTGTPGYRDGPGAQAQFNGPIGVAVDAAGRVLVADTYNDRIRAIAADGQVSTLAGGALPGDADGPADQARFDTPCALAVDAQGQVWIADTRNDALRRLDPQGNVTTVARPDVHDDQALLRRPVSLALRPDGTLLVAALRRGAVLQVSPQGQVRPFLADDALRFSRPTALVLGPGPRVLVADAASARIHALAPRDDGGTTAQLDGPLGPAADRVLPATAGRWPVRPQEAWHEVVGTLGEVRGTRRSSRDHLHDGLDIRGDVGQPVLAIADAKVSSPLGSWGYGQLGEGIALDRLVYSHLRVGRLGQGRGMVTDPARFVLLNNAAGKPERVRVRRGTRFVAGEVLGSINGMAHVHLTVGPSGYEMNPLRLGFKDFRDHQAPRITAVEFYDTAGKRLAYRPGQRILLPRTDWQLVVDAWDQVDDNLPRRRLGLYSLGYQWLRSDGQAVADGVPPPLAIEFAHLSSNPLAAEQTYADHSGVSVQSRVATRFRYVLSPAAGASEPLPAGDYTLRLIARDYAGNQATQGRDLAISLR
jgi:sugar lactone lactonase YvrE